jgi:hypothetical protein
MSTNKEMQESKQADKTFTGISNEVQPKAPTTARRSGVGYCKECVTQ